MSIILCRECGEYINTIEVKSHDRVFYSHGPANTCIDCFEKWGDMGVETAERNLEFMKKIGWDWKPHIRKYESIIEKERIDNRFEILDL